MLSVVSGVNAFDQWGVVPGKEPCGAIAPLVRATAIEEFISLRGALQFVASVP